jgi:hypothetical protein
VIKDAALISDCRGLADDLIAKGLPEQTIKAIELADAAALKRS